MAGGFTITIDAAALGAIRDRLSPQRMERLAEAAMEESLAYLKGRIQADLPVNTGVSRASVFTELNGRPLTGLDGVVASPLESVAAWEWGRRPGATQPPVSAIRQWMRRRLGTDDARVAFLIARAIGRRGLPAHHVFRDAAEKGAPVVRRIFLKHLGGL